MSHLVKMAEIRKRPQKSGASTSSSNTPPRGPIRAKNADLFRKNLVYLILSGLSIILVYWFNSAPAPPFSESESGLTDEQLSQYTGGDPDKPIYVAINGTIFDVSEGRSFYGPGGHYHHFAGRDATRAWVSTCFDPEYLNWDMKGIEKMFMPKWMDEEIQDAADGKSSADSTLSPELVAQAAKALKKIGKVSEKEKRRRRVEDREEVGREIEKAMKHWVDFFRNNPKYKEVGRVVGRKPLPEDRKVPGLCEEALKKRPVKGGNFEKVMGAAMGMGMDGSAAAAGDALKKAPDFVKSEGP
jgi:predicted heme/steroid binding protein